MRTVKLKFHLELNATLIRNLKSGVSLNYKFCLNMIHAKPLPILDRWKAFPHVGAYTSYSGGLFMSLLESIRLS